MIIFFGRHVSRGNKSKAYSREKNDISTQRPIELIHLDLYGPTRTDSIGCKRYDAVIFYDFTRWTWVKFLSH